LQQPRTLFPLPHQHFATSSLSLPKGKAVLPITLVFQNFLGMRISLGLSAGLPSKASNSFSNWQSFANLHAFSPVPFAKKAYVEA